MPDAALRSSVHECGRISQGFARWLIFRAAKPPGTVVRIMPDGASDHQRKAVRASGVAFCQRNFFLEHWLLFSLQRRMRREFDNGMIWQ